MDIRYSRISTYGHLSTLATFSVPKVAVVERSNFCKMTARDSKWETVKIVALKMVVFSLQMVHSRWSYKWKNNISYQGPVLWKMVKFNPGLSQILSKVFLSKNM